MTNNPEKEHVSVHHEDSAGNGGPPNKEGSTRDLIVRSIFPDIATIDPITLAASANISVLAPLASVGTTYPTQQCGKPHLQPQQVRTYVPLQHVVRLPPT
jgi:hypothetical protein